MALIEAYLLHYCFECARVSNEATVYISLLLSAYPCFGKKGFLPFKSQGLAEGFDIWNHERFKTLLA